VGSRARNPEGAATMERIKGMVLEIKGRRAIILTPDGDFREVPAYRPDWEIGQCIEVPVREPIALKEHRRERAGAHTEASSPGRRRFRWSAGIVAAAMILAVVMMFGSWGPAASQPAYAAVSVDLHSGSYRLYVDAAQNVVSASAASTAGMELLKRTDYKGQPLDQVIELLVREAVSAGDLQPDRPDQVVLMSASVLEPDVQDSPGGVAKLKEGLQKASQKGQAKLRARDVDAPVAVLTVTSPSLSDRAAELGLTVNEYLILLKARDLGLDISIKDMRGKRYVPRLRKQGISLEQMLVHIQKEDDLLGLSARHHNDLVREWEDKGKKESDGKTVVEVQPAVPGIGPDAPDGRAEEPDVVLDEPTGSQDAASQTNTVPGADTDAKLPGWMKNGKRPDRAEDKVGRWLKKLHPPGLFKAKHTKGE